MDETKKQSTRRRMKAVIVSNKMDKTAVVRIDRTEIHSKYLKRFTVSKRLKVHDADNSAEVGQIVMIEETRPMSKDKHWRIVKKV